MSPPFIVVGLALGLVVTIGVTQTQATSGDLNCDGTQDGADIGPFLLAVIDPSTYTATFPGCLLRNADFDCDGGADPDDISGFVDCLLNGNCPPCPPPGMVLVPAGEFQMGDPWNEGATDERPVHSVSLNAYYVDTYEVTNQQYAARLNWAWTQGGLIRVTNGVVYQNAGSPPYCSTTSAPTGSPYYGEYSRITWDGNTFGVVAGKENHPMVLVSWYGCCAYCNWRSAMEGKPLCFNLMTWTCDFGAAGYRLPTEAEWEKAAGWDPVQSRHFRFGEHTDGCGFACLDSQRANYRLSGDPFESGAIPGSYPWTTPVGFYNGALHYKADFGWPGSQTSYQTQDARSHYGCYDMSGGVSELCYDLYSSTYYSSSPASNPTGPATGGNRVLRGGSWNRNADYSRTADRVMVLPDSLYNEVGFRCAMSTD